MSRRARIRDSHHDGQWAKRQAHGPQVKPSETEASDEPTRAGHGKVYFRYQMSSAHRCAVECDISPGAALDAEHRLLKGHVRLLCPRCSNPMHIDAANKTVYCLPVATGALKPGVGTRRHVFGPEDGFKDNWLLPVLTVVEPVKCNYRERGGGEEGCRWHVVIADGTAYDHGRVVQGAAGSAAQAKPKSEARDAVHRAVADLSEAARVPGHDPLLGRTVLFDAHGREAKPEVPRPEATPEAKEKP